MLFNIFFQHWQFPRGGVEVGESDQACAIRELAEETGLTLAQLQPESECMIHYSIEIQQHILERTIIYFLGEVQPGAVQIDPDEHSEFRWVDVEEARQLLTETSPEQIPVLDAVLGCLSVESKRGFAYRQKVS